MVCVYAFAIADDNENSVRIIRHNAIEINGEPMVLYGISVPLPTEKCLSNDDQWTCGAAATLQLYAQLKKLPLNCSPISSTENIPLARCHNSESDIARLLVSDGWAITVNGSLEYKAEEETAKSTQVGIWRAGYSPPENWRRYPEFEFNPILDLLCSTCAVRKN